MVDHYTVTLKNQQNLKGSHGDHWLISHGMTLAPICRGSWVVNVNLFGCTGVVQLPSVLIQPDSLIQTYACKLLFLQVTDATV